MTAAVAHNFQKIAASRPVPNDSGESVVLPARCGLGSAVGNSGRDSCQKHLCPGGSPAVSPHMADRKLGCLSIFLFVALCASVFANFVLIAALVGRTAGVVGQQELPPRFREVQVERGDRGSNDKVALIVMRGLISSNIPGTVSDSMVDDMRAALQQARDDKRVKAVVLEIDSPGGEVTASDEIYNAVVKTRATKPVVIYMDTLAASGGYYVSCGGKFLMANETTITGSIGVIIQTLNYEQLFNKIGLASVVFKSGKVQRHAQRRAPDHAGRTRARPKFRHENLRQVSRHRRERTQSPGRQFAQRHRGRSHFVGQRSARAQVD